MIAVGRVLTNDTNADLTHSSDEDPNKWTDASALSTPVRSGHMKQLVPAR